MRVVDIGMILAPTVRSNIYLQLLLLNNIKPSSIILLGNSNKNLNVIPGQLPEDVKYYLEEKFDLSKYFNPNIKIIDLINEYNIEVHKLDSTDINSLECIDVLKNHVEKYFIYSGFGGALLREKILSIGKKFLHMHAGSVPNYRGSTTTYYHLLDGNQCYVSAFFLEKDIDTGPVIKIKAFPKPENGELIDYIYDPFIRAQLMVEVIQEYIVFKDFSAVYTEEKEETYFIIHPVLKHLAILSCN